MNQVSLLGNLTKELELKQAKETQVPYTQFTLAVDEKHSKKDKRTYFIEIVAFHKKAIALTRYAKKGQQILVQGKIVTDSFMNKDGEKVYSTKVLLEDFCLTGTERPEEIIERQAEKVVS